MYSSTKKPHKKIYLGAFQVINVMLFLNLFGFFGGYASLLSDELGNAGDLYKIIWFLIYFLNVIFISKSIIDSSFTVPNIVLVFSLYVAFSFLWSVIPQETFIYSVSVIMNIFSALYFAQKIPLVNLVKLLHRFLFFYILTGLFLAVIGMEIAFYIDPLERGNIIGLPLVKGLFSHKIYAGFYGVFFLILTMIQPLSRVRYWSSILLAFSSVFISGSTLSIMLLFIFTAFYFYFFIVSRVRYRQIFHIALFCFFAFIVYFGFNYSADILIALGRDPTLTGRSELWAFGLDFWAQKPLLGWGYSGIFSDVENAPSWIINDHAYYQAPHFHNAFIQSLAELGIIGFLFLMYFVVQIVSKVGVIVESREKTIYLQAFNISMLLIFFFMNIGLRYNEFTTFYIFLMYYYISKGTLKSEIN